MFSLSRHLLGKSTLGSKAAFSTTPAAQLDLSNLYSKLTGWRRKKPVSEAVVDPTKSKESERSEDSMPVDSRPRKLKIIGAPKPLEEEWPNVRQFAEFQAWPTNHYRRDLTSQEIEEAVSKVNQVDFSNIQSRFEAVKLVSQSLKIGIADTVLTNLTSVEKLKDHLLQSARPFDERQPDAIYLNQEDFTGLNITISDPVAERKAEKQKLHKLLTEAKQKQKQVADEVLRSS